MDDVRNLGKYRIIAALGHGGMAEVFLSLITGPLGSGFTKLAVIKRLHPHLAEDPEFIAMLVDEARISARLNHANVVQTLEVGFENEQYFLAMEFLDGQPLHRIQRRAKKIGAPLSAQMQYLVVADALAGLQHAHELADYDGTSLGIVHRDVTPQNLFVTYDGQVKVVDFGIAKAAGRASETRQGIIKGKVRYMSPEQAVGRAVDCRSDIFAAGVLLWEAATGVHFWRDLEELAIVEALVSGNYDPSPRSVDPSVPAAIDAMCRKALSPDAEHRYQSAGALRADLEGFLSESVVGVRRALGPLVAGMFAKERRAVREVIERTSRQNVDTMSIAALTSSRAMMTTSSSSSSGSGESALSMLQLTGDAPPVQSLAPVMVSAASLAVPRSAPEPMPSRLRSVGLAAAAFFGVLVVALGALGVTSGSSLGSSLFDAGSAPARAGRGREAVSTRTSLSLESKAARSKRGAERESGLTDGPLVPVAHTPDRAMPSVVAASPSDSVSREVPSAAAPAPTTALPPLGGGRSRPRPSIDTADPWGAAQ